MNKFDSTLNIVGAVHDVAKLRSSLNSLYGSGVIVRIDNFTEGQPAHVRDVCVPADAAGKVVDGIIDALHVALVTRQLALRDELKTVEKCLATYYSSVDK